MTSTLEGVLYAFGGLGLFLLGMVVMTDALHQLAGSQIRSALMRFTRSPLSGALTGAAGTAILQSSSVTTVTAVGFVASGMLSFKEALGIIFGANVGTTLKGWLLVLLGFKFKLTMLMFPLLFVAVLMKLLARERWATSAMAVAGFCLIFLGMDMMQQGMTGFQGLVTPEDFPPDTLAGRFTLLLMGIAITLVTQSSSAGVAASLTALYAGNINFHQAAALVIGMDVGTTVTAALATIGGSVASRRTGYSHVIYNLMTATLALALLSPYVFIWEWGANGRIADNAELALVGFHTLFNTLGVVLVLPFAGRFEQMINYFIKAEESSYTEPLEDALLKEPGLAITNVESSLSRQLSELYSYLADSLRTQPADIHRFAILMRALDETQNYVDLLHLKEEEGMVWQRLLSLIHIIDHMQRLHERLKESPQRIEVLNTDMQTRELLRTLADGLAELTLMVEEKQWAQIGRDSEKRGADLTFQLDQQRNRIMRNIALGVFTVPEAEERMEAVRWLQRVVNHIQRLGIHIQEMDELPKG